jgi:RNA recognition motif. (a.k.a. RRM, RBD, or RNP domain)
VFVAELPDGLTDEQFAEAFDPCGLALTARRAREFGSGGPRRHGVVQIAPDHALGKAIAGLDATGIGGRRIEARRADRAMAIVVPAKFLSRRRRA